MTYINRIERITSLFPKEPGFRLKQIEAALFQEDCKDWGDVSTLPAAMREVLTEKVPFISLKTEGVYPSKDGNTFKAILSVTSGEEIETVMMKNSRGHFTICVSSQIGCAMGCDFCATGKMGLTRNLDAEEIVDQYRVWQLFLSDHPELPQFISNIVYMGMGEPMANYENVKPSINSILKHTEIGITHITVSTVGVLPRLEKLLEDPDWPHVRMAVSLHSADPETRMKIMPSSYDDFLPKLADWCKRYLVRFGNRNHHLTFEYVMLRGVNDSPHHAKLLAKFSQSIGKVRVNLIPYNFTNCGYGCSSPEVIEKFNQTLEKHGVTVTVRKSQGDDIEAACGQLIKKKTQQ